MCFFPSDVCNAVFRALGLEGSGHGEDLRRLYNGFSGFESSLHG